MDSDIKMIIDLDDTSNPLSLLIRKALEHSNIAGTQLVYSMFKALKYKALYIYKVNKIIVTDSKNNLADAGLWHFIG